jgi:hypothetical protein
MAKQPNPKEFLYSFTKSWATAMSGPLSVPFAIAAVYFENTSVKIISALAAVICALFASYGVWKNEREAVRALEAKIHELNGRIDDLKMPKFIVLFDPAIDIRPTEILPHEALADTIHSTQYGIRVTTESVEAIQEFEVCCEAFQVITQEPIIYSVILGGGYHPRTLCCGDKFPAGILKELVERDFYGGVTRKRIDIQAYSRGPRGTFAGKDFAITIRIQGDKTSPVTKCYQFGDREGFLHLSPQHPAMAAPKMSCVSSAWTLHVSFGALASLL